MNLDDEIRSTLHTRAEEAPDGVGLLDNVRTRARRRQYRRRIQAVGVVAAVGVGVSATTPYLVGLMFTGPGLAASAGPSATHTSTPTPTPTPTTTTLKAPDRRSTIQLAATAVPPVTFPFTPQWTPPGLPGPVVGHNQDADYLVYEADSPNMLVYLSRTPLPPDWSPTSTQMIHVGTRPATLTTGTTSTGLAAVRLVWQLADHRWVDIQAGGLTKDQVKRYADNLAPRPFTRPLPFTLALAPVGVRVSFQELHPQEFHYCVARPGRLTDVAGYLCLSQNPSLTPPASSEPVQVGADPGEIAVADGIVTLIVHRPGFEFIVTESSHGELSNADLIRFAAGVSKAQ